MEEARRENERRRPRGGRSDRRGGCGDGAIASGSKDALVACGASALKAFDESIGGNKQPVPTKALKSKAAKALREAQTAFDKQKQNVEAGVEMAAEEENWGVGGPNSLRSVMARVMLASTTPENRQKQIRRDEIIEGAHVLDPQFEERPWRAYVDAIGAEIRSSKMPRWDQHGSGVAEQIYHSLTEVGEALAEGSAGQALVEADRELLRLTKSCRWRWRRRRRLRAAKAAKRRGRDDGTPRGPVRSWTSSRGLIARCLLAGCRRFNGILGRCQLFVDPEQPNASDKRLRNALNAEKDAKVASLAARHRVMRMY